MSTCLFKWLTPEMMDKKHKLQFDWYDIESAQYSHDETFTLTDDVTFQYNFLTNELNGKKHAKGTILHMVQYKDVHGSAQHIVRFNPKQDANKPVLVVNVDFATWEICGLFAPAPTPHEDAKIFILGLFVFVVVFYTLQHFY
jgi:hypothetical protein